MKKSLLIALLAVLPLSAPLARADSTHHTDKDSKSAMPMTEKNKQMEMGKMQENMLKMHTQMHKIMDAKDPQERERLMQENMQTMKDNMQMMQMMHSKMGQGKMGGDAKGGNMGGDTKGGNMGGDAKGGKMEGMKGM